MKHIKSLPGYILIIFSAVYCVTGAIIDGFSLSVDTGYLIAVLLCFTILVASAVLIWRGTGLLSLLPLPALFIFWRLEEILDGARWVICQITSQYNVWLNVNVLFPFANAGAGEITLFFIAAGMIIIFLLGFAVVYRQSVLITAAVTVPPVFLTFILISTQPNPGYLIGLLTAHLVLLFRNALQKSDPGKKSMQFYPALIIALILLCTAYIIIPQRDFKRSNFINDFSNYIKNAAGQSNMSGGSSLFGWFSLNSDGTWSFDTDRVYISDSGHRNTVNVDLLRITASVPGTFYLRGYSMEYFDGRSWHPDPVVETLSQENTAKYMPAYIAWVHGVLNPDSRTVEGELKIEKLADITDIMYYPYYSGHIPADNITPVSYDIDYIYTEENIIEIYNDLPDHVFREINLLQYGELMDTHRIFTQIYSASYNSLRRLAVGAGIDPAAERSVIADKVAAYVSSAAEYTLTPGAVPPDEDFALYFLETLKQGY